MYRAVSTRSGALVFQGSLTKFASTQSNVFSNVTLSSFFFRISDNVEKVIWSHAGVISDIWDLFEENICIAHSPGDSCMQTPHLPCSVPHLLLACLPPAHPCYICPCIPLVVTPTLAAHYSTSGPTYPICCCCLGHPWQQFVTWQQFS